MATLKTIAPQLGVKPDTLRRKLKAAPHNLKIGINQELPEEVVKKLLPQSAPLRSDPDQPKPAPPKPLNPKPQKPAPLVSESAIKKANVGFVTKPRFSVNWETVLPVLPLPMLGLAASYGVYLFSSFFVPDLVAIGEAAAFELTYIGLAMTKRLGEKQQNRAYWVAFAAVGVSVVYNTLAGVMHLEPDWFQNMRPVWVWVLAAVHGLPLAALAFQVAQLLLHRRK
jgi:hypothetical protein